MRPQSQVQATGRAVLPPANLESNGSFTSVDIDTPHVNEEGNASWWSESTASDSHQTSSTAGCFDIRTDLLCTNAIAIAISGSPAKCQHHPVNNDGLDATGSQHHHQQPVNGMAKPAAHRKLHHCSLIGIIFLSLAIVAIIAVGIFMYVQFALATNNSSASSSAGALNETVNLCELIVDGCSNATSLAVNSTSAADTTSLESQSGRVQANFSSSFINQLNKLDKKA